MKITKGRVAALILVVLLAGILAALAVDPPDPEVSDNEVEAIFALVQAQLQEQFGEGAFVPREGCVGEHRMCLRGDSVPVERLEGSLGGLLPSGFEKTESACGVTPERAASSYCTSLWRRGQTLLFVQLDFPRSPEDGEEMRQATNFSVSVDATLGWPWSWYPDALR